MRGFIRFAAATGLAAAAGTAQAQTTVYRNTFDAAPTTSAGVSATLSGSSSTYDVGSRTGCNTASGATCDLAAAAGTSGNPFALAGQGINLALSGIGAHSMTKVFMDILVFGSIDGPGAYGPDNIRIVLDGVTLAHQVYGAQVSNPLGSSGGAWGHLSGIYGFEFSIAHAGSTLDLQVLADGGWQGWPDEGFSVDNLEIRADLATAPPTAAVPEPSTVILLGSGLLALGVAARRRAQK